MKTNSLLQAQMPWPVFLYTKNQSIIIGDGEYEVQFTIDDFKEVESKFEIDDSIGAITYEIKDGIKDGLQYDTVYINGNVEPTYKRNIEYDKYISKIKIYAKAKDDVLNNPIRKYKDLNEAKLAMQKSVNGMIDRYISTLDEVTGFSAFERMTWDTQTEDAKKVLKGEKTKMLKDIKLKDETEESLANDILFNKNKFDNLVKNVLKKKREIMKELHSLNTVTQVAQYWSSLPEDFGDLLDEK